MINDSPHFKPQKYVSFEDLNYIITGFDGKKSHLESSDLSLRIISRNLIVKGLISLLHMFSDVGKKAEHFRLKLQ